MPKDKHYRPDFRNKALTEKFYARHESFAFDAQLLNSPLVKKYIQLISEQQKIISQNRPLAPITENQKYGWLLHLAMQPKDELDSSLFYYPRICDSQLKLVAAVEAAKKLSR